MCETNHVEKVGVNLKDFLDGIRLMRDGNISPSETLYGFAAWLSADDTVLRHGLDDCAWWSEKVRDFCNANHFDAPKDNWTRKIIYPSKEEYHGDT